MCSHSHHGDDAAPLNSASYPIRAAGPVGKRVTSLYQKRLPNFFTEGQWEKANLLAMLNYGVYSEPPYISLAVWHAPSTERPTFQAATADSNLYEPTNVGQAFGPSWTTHWFRVTIRVPEQFIGADKTVELHWDCSNEATVWTEHGEPLQGLTGRGERPEWILPDSFKDGQEHTMFVEMACNGMFGNGPGRPIFKNNAGGDSIQPPDMNKHFKLSKAELVMPDMEARMLYMDFQIIHDAAMEFPEEAWERHEALNVASRIIDTFKVGDSQSIRRCRKIAEEYLGSDINSAAVFKAVDDKKPTVFAVGHCHIDTCWLWPWAETKRKVVRSWSNQCDLMDRYPELQFACSQAQQFKWLKEEYPYAFERVKAKVKSGQFDPIGGCWVEHDTNLPSGESLVRQFLYGQRFFESNFGARSTTCWLPDTFGFSSQIPQLCRLAGMNRFLTQKPCFNSVNEFPHTSFNWVALDGSQVICHMPPAKTYCAEASFGDISRSISNHKSLDQDNTALLAFGKGDGGGGPTWRHLERLRRLRGLSDTTGLLPRVHSGSTVDEFFDGLEKKASSLVTWYGELYFELHRGVYTTQAKTKLNNRKTEFLLRDIEFLATVASIQDKSYRYPKKEIDEMWEGVMLCQFHDCLPGSAIKMCYDDSDAVYANVFQTGVTLLEQVYKVLGVEEPTPDRPSGESYVALNTLPWSRQEVVNVDDETAVLVEGSGNFLATKTFEASADERAVTVKEVSEGVFQLQNEHLRATVEKGCVTSLYDRRANREVMSGKANQYVIFDDKPIYWQAWDVEVYHLETREVLESSATSISEDKPWRVSVVTETKIGSLSSIRTTISLSAALSGEQSYVECTADVDWHETMKFLKVEFPVAVRNTEASYETQYGIVKRPTHYNTSWDMAKFEVCCQKFADLSEYNYGVSILNDSKYGFATAGSVMRLSLLRSPKAPDDTADMGHHKIRWAILPHQRPLGVQTVRCAYNFNNPLRLLSAKSEATGLAADSLPISLTGDQNLVLDTIKRGEDDEDVSLGELPKRPGKSVIIRVYDALGGHGRATVETKWPVAKVFLANLLEDDLEEIAVQDGKFEIELEPFQVNTYRIVLGDGQLGNSGSTSR
ncbi:alpha-mannosidase [Thozetella sp. PMI_491]|nr:alpha-mannosidase [Thozetella sp. PMI_491]